MSDLRRHRAGPGGEPGERLAHLSSPSAFRVAIVGLGPKGLYGLESLACALAELEPHRRPKLAVHLFEPHPNPGAGPNYDPRQPDYLRLNFSNRHVDMWTRPQSRSEARAFERFPFSRSDFLHWLQRHHPEFADPHGHAPRALVGAYLHSGFRDLCDWLSSTPGIQLQLHRQTVVCIEPSAEESQHPETLGETAAAAEPRQWRVVTDGGHRLTVQEVLITTGHSSRAAEPWPANGEHLRGLHGRTPTMSVYPVSQLYSIRAGSRVGLRGFGLTAIDAILALTEGRGGRFEASSGASAQDVRYLPSGDEPSTIVPFSRTGRPMLPKPEPEHAIGGVGTSWVDLAIETIWEDAAARLGEQAELAAPSIGSQVVEELCTSADDALELHLAKIWPKSSRPVPSPPARRRLDELLERRWTAVTPDQLQRDVCIAYGQLPPDIDWALSASWRALYPTLVSLVASSSLAGEEWPRFAALATEMERLAFGPPAENAARIACLARCGLLQFPVTPQQSVGPVPHGHLPPLREVEAVIDAVIAPPGAAPRPSELLNELLERGALRTLPWNAGIEIDARARAIGTDGLPTPGISVIGRPTEGAVLGNDTLSRTLHDHPRRWAQQVLEQGCADRSKELPDARRAPAGRGREAVA